MSVHSSRCSRSFDIEAVKQSFKRGSSILEGLRGLLFFHPGHSNSLHRSFKGSIVRHRVRLRSGIRYLHYCRVRRPFGGARSHGILGSTLLRAVSSSHSGVRASHLYHGIRPDPTRPIGVVVTSLVSSRLQLISLPTGEPRTSSRSQCRVNPGQKTIRTTDHLPPLQPRPSEVFQETKGF